MKAHISKAQKLIAETLRCLLILINHRQPIDAKLIDAESGGLLPKEGRGSTPPVQSWGSIGAMMAVKRATERYAHSRRQLAVRKWYPGRIIPPPAWNGPCAEIRPTHGHSSTHN